MGRPRPHETAPDGGRDSHDDAATTVLGEAAVEVAAAGQATPVVRVGRYVVLEEVGRGAMGRVLRAYDPKLQREVALKDLGVRDLGPDAAARLVAEARAMAKLSHPNVITVHDVEATGEGTPSGSIVLVMEYVAGRTLQGWLVERSRTWSEIVRCYADAGRGLAAAHAVGILHRDFKPANVLVGDDGSVKVGDFGLAKADADDAVSELPAHASLPGTEWSDESVPATQTGVVMGSPRYMAPEQHEGRQLTVAADQYSYCVALWEALAGQPPFLGPTLRALHEAKAAGPPPFARSGVPRRIIDAIRRGLSPDPDQRWPNMDALLMELTHDPGRRRKIMAGVATVGLLAAGSVAVRSWGAPEPCRGSAAQLDDVWGEERRAAVASAFEATETVYAADALRGAIAALDDYAARWARAHTEACEASVVRKVQSAQMMDLRMACLHRARVALSAATATLARADAKIVQQAHVVVGQLPALSRCADLAALQAEVEPPSAADADAVEAARVALADAKAMAAAAHTDEAMDELDAVEATLADVAYEPIQAELAMIRGEVLHDRGEFDAAETQMLRALELSLVWHQWDTVFRAATMLMGLLSDDQERPREALRYRELAAALARRDPSLEASYENNLGRTLGRAHEYPEAEVALRRALEIWLHEVGPDALDVAVARNNLAVVLLEQRKNGEAEAQFRQVIAARERALGAHHPLVARARANLALSLLAQGEQAEAEREQRDAIATMAAALGPDHAELGGAWQNLSAILDAKPGGGEEALRATQRASAIFDAALGPEHHQSANGLANLGADYTSLADWPSAEATLREALRRFEALGETDTPRVAEIRGNLAIVLEGLGQVETAEAQWRQVRAIIEPAYGPESEEAATAWYNHATTLRRLGRLEESQSLLRRAIVVFDKIDSPTGRGATFGRRQLARVLLDRGDAEAALREAQTAWSAVQDAQFQGRDRGGVAFVLARALWATGTDSKTRARARELADQALASYRADERTDADDLAEAEAWRRAH